VTDNKSLGQIVEIIMEESDARNPLHSRRMELLRVKKTGSHSDYLFNLEQIGDLIDMQSLTLDSLIMHLFLE
jgi:ribosome biogenesis GTPase A